MTGKSRLLTAALGVLICLAGCSITTGIGLTNGSAEDLGWVYIVPAGTGYDGAEDQLSGTMKPGDLELFAVSPGTWDIRWGVEGSGLPLGGAQDGVVADGRITYLEAVAN